jgi:hypothetical protein
MKRIVLSIRIAITRFWMEVRLMSSHYGPYRLGYTCVTLKFDNKMQRRELERIYKRLFSSDLKLKLILVKPESLVIVD